MANVQSSNTGQASNTLGAGLSFNSSNQLTGGPQANLPIQQGIGSIFGFNLPAQTGILQTSQQNSAPINPGTSTPINAANATTNPISTAKTGLLGGTSAAGYTAPTSYDPMTGKVVAPGQPLTPRQPGHQPLFDIVTGKPLNTSSNPPVTSTPPPTTVSAANGAPNLSQLSNPYSGLLQNYLNQQGAYQGDVNTYNQNLAQYGKNLGNITGMTGVIQPFVTGAAQAYEAEAAPTLQSEAQALQTEQGALGTSLGAVGAAAPTGNIINVSPITGQPVAGGSLGGLAALSGKVNQQQQQGGQYQTNLGALNQIQGLTDQLQSLITSAGINPSDINGVNSFIQKIASNTSNPNYGSFNNLINEIASKYATILTPSGGSTTDLTKTISQSLLNPTASGQSILQVLQSLDQQSQTENNSLLQTATDQSTPGSTNANPTSGFSSFFNNFQAP